MATNQCRCGAELRACGGPITINGGNTTCGTCGGVDFQNAADGDTCLRSVCAQSGQPPHLCPNKA